MNFFFIATDIYQPLVPSYQTGISLVTTLFKKTCKYIFIFIHIFRYVHGTLGLAQVGSGASEQCWVLHPLWLLPRLCWARLSKAHWHWHHGAAGPALEHPGQRGSPTPARLRAHRGSWHTKAPGTPVRLPAHQGTQHTKAPGTPGLPAHQGSSVVQPQEPGAAPSLSSSPSCRPARLSAPYQDVPSWDAQLALWPCTAHGRGFQLNQVGILKHRIHGKEV